MPSAAPEFLVLQQALAGEYSLQRELGRGGMGIVYLARDVQLDRDVAIKVLPGDLARVGNARERFMREARLAAGLSHPHIVPIHRVGDAGGLAFFVMSYIDGETLGERLRRDGPLPAAEASRVLREVAWALAYAHGRGIVHRDVKPDNILIEAGSGRSLVTDFGIAHGAPEAGLRTDPGQLMGTAHFMSPEQAAGEIVDGRSDIYALGVVGHLAVSGRLPFDAPSLGALLVRQATETPPRLSLVAPGLPPSLCAAIDRCLRPDPEARFQDGEALAAALAPPAETRPSLPPMLRAWLATRNPMLVPYLGWSGGFGVLTLGNLVAWVTGNRPDGPADIVLLAGITALPLLPIIGFHLNQASRQFAAGHSLADLRAALDIARRERADAEALVPDGPESRAHRVLRAATIASGTWLATTVGLLLQGVIHENRDTPLLIVAPVFSTLLLAAVTNALDVRFVPRRVRAWWQQGLRDRLWTSRLGAWFAQRLSAPERSRIVDAHAFRATEVALGAAAAELFEALPASYREQLDGLPTVIEALEARAAAARAEVDLVAALSARGSDGIDPLTERRQTAATQLADAVAALEGVRLDLLRLHAGAGDLAPLTTLMDAARELGDEASRLAAARRQLDTPDR